MRLRRADFSMWVWQTLGPTVVSLLKEAREQLARSSVGSPVDAPLAAGTAAAGFDDGWCFGWVAVEQLEPSETERVRVIYLGDSDGRQHALDIQSRLPAYDDLSREQRARGRRRGSPSEHVARDIGQLMRILDGHDPMLESDGAGSFVASVRQTPDFDSHRLVMVHFFDDGAPLTGRVGASVRLQDVDDGYEHGAASTIGRDGVAFWDVTHGAYECVVDDPAGRPGMRWRSRRLVVGESSGPVRLELNDGDFERLAH